MNILVVGRGGREHSIVMKFAESSQVNNIYAAPGNGGINQHATCISIDEMDFDGLVEFAKNKEIDLTIVGPENPLNAGIVDRFHQEDLAIFGPTKAAALLEGSKKYAKEFMEKHAIPTADYRTFTNVDDAKLYIEENGAPIVIKADGLAAGKGVVVAETKDQALQAVDDMLVAKTFSEAGATIVIEEFLDGKEFSLMAFVHENNVYPMVPARDHKRAYDNDLGPNTGGMGAFAPVADITEAHIAFAMENILQKTADGLIQEDRPFTGILYAGLIMTAQGPKVIEFNTRFGDPETQVVLPLLVNDLEQVLMDVMNGNDPRLKWEGSGCVGVVVTSAGYPAEYAKGVPLPQMAASESCFTVHAGTKLAADSLVSDGGRVLLIGAKSTSIEEAAVHVYRDLEPLSKSKEFFYRRDIGKL